MASAAEIRSITSVLRQRTRTVSAANAASVLQLAGAITRANTALTQGRPSGISDADWNAFRAAIRDANAARSREARGTLRPSPFETTTAAGTPEDPMIFGEEVLGPEIVPTTRAPGVKAPTPGWEEGLPAIQQVTGKVQEAAEAVAETVGGAWQSVKRAVGLPAAPLQPPRPPVTPGGVVRQAGDVAEQLIEEAEARGVPVQTVAREAQQTIRPVVAPQPVGPNWPLIIAGGTAAVGGVWLLASYLKKRSAKKKR